MKLVTTLASLTITWIAATNCVGADQLDQFHDVPTDPSHARAIGTGAFKVAAQIFTVGLGGTLSEVDVALYRSSDFPGSVAIDISRVNSGVPDFSDSGRLATRSFATSVIPVGSTGVVSGSKFRQVDFSGDHVEVRPGDSLAIILRWSYYGPEYIGWWQNTDSQPSYAGGSFFQYDLFAGNPPIDLGEVMYDGQFRTYVTLVPEPSTHFLAVCGLLLAALLHRQRFVT